MKIQRKKSNILLTAEKNKILIAYEEDVLFETNPEIVVSKINSPKLDTKLSSFVISTCGEYEEKGIMVQALPTVGSNSIDIISIDCEGMNIVIADSNTSLLNKKNLEQIGINNILLFNDIDGVGKIFEIIDELAPQFIVVIGSDVTVELINKKLSLNIPEKQKIFSISRQDLPNEEDGNPIQLVLLD